MAQRVRTANFTTVIPGAYPTVTVKSTPVGIGASGDIVIIGEAAGGADYSSEILKDNFYSATQLDQVANKYISGPIVDAMRALVSPSSDSNIQGSINRVYIAKSNAGTQASGAVPSGYGTLVDKNYGTDGNKYYYQTTQIESEVAPTITSDAITVGDGSAFSGLSFSVRKDGEAVTVVTLSAVDADHDSIGELAAEISAQLPAGLSCSAVGSALKITYAADASANAKGWGKSFELIDSTPGDLATIELSEGLTVSSQEPEVQLTVNRQDTNTNETYEIEAEIALLLGYEGTTATVTINDGMLTTTRTGGAGADLSIDMSNYPTMKDLADYISSQTGYTASYAAASTSLSPLKLDEVSGVGICSTEADLTPGRIKRAAWNFQNAVSESSVVDFEATLEAGLPSVMSAVAYLSGGALGATTSADIVAIISQLEGIKVNFVIPLFSRDAADDIADDLTDSSSTYTIDAINLAIKSHCLAMSTTKMKRNRIALLSKDASYAEAKSHAQTLAHYRCIAAFQRSSQVDAFGVITEQLPWHTAVIAAGMQSAGFYKSLTNKFANVVSFKDPSGFDSGNPGQLEDAIEAGLLILQKETAGSKFVVDQTTYGFDGNFVYNSMQAVYMADVLAIDLSDSLQRSFVGQSLADVDAATALSFITKKMDEYKKAKIIAGSDDAPLGFRNVKIDINGPIMSVKVEVKLATAILFIPLDIEVSQVQSSASL